MKRVLILLILMIFLLAGCGGDPAGTTAPETEPQPTLSWVEASAEPWDREGTLLEIPLTIPGGMHYSSHLAFNGDILFWSTDYHLEDTVVLELCVFDLDTGTVFAQKDISFPNFAMVQVLQQYIYLCDSQNGRIHVLDQSLETVKTWETEAFDGAWYMGGNEQLYLYDWNGQFTVRDLNTGETRPVLDGAPYVENVIAEDGYASVQYFREDTGAPCYAIVDLITGELSVLEENGDYYSTAHMDGFWLFGSYGDANRWFIREDGGETCQVRVGQDYLQLLGNGQILRITEDYTGLSLYDLQGKAIAQCRISYEGYNYTSSELIWNDQFGGYFLMLSGYAGDQRLLFWDISTSDTGEDLLIEPVPEPSEQIALLKQRAQELSEKYGVIIYVADDCETQFDEFSATQISDYDQVNRALDILDEALGKYPEGFFHQLRYGSVHSIRIHLITDLMADGSGRYGDGYVAFAQNMWDHYLVVIDIEDSDCQTYYHEFSHVIDSYLAWDAGQRDDALFSEEGWADRNPAWFNGYSYDYSVEHELVNDAYFVDGYSTISPTEDRARVMEYAMSDYGFYTFEDNQGLQMKLEYYCLCIRDAFDTEGWPEALPWEQYLE